MSKAKIPNTNIALLSDPAKMPGLAWGMTARLSCPRANGTICIDCYADKNAYRFPDAVRAYEARFAWAKECMRTADGRREFVATMVSAISRQRSKHFRIHDSGDFFSAAYVDCWYLICQQLPRIRFWSPTRSWQRPAARSASSPFVIVGQSDPIMSALRRLAELPNVTVRPSALNFGDPAPSVAGLAAGSAAGDVPLGHYLCPAPQQGGNCGDCRVCWDSPEIPVAYKRH